MTDQPHYDPDGPPIDDLLAAAAGNDNEILRLIGEYLDDPVANALVNDLGRQQRSRPAGEQIADLEDLIASTIAERDDLVPLFEGNRPPEVLAKLAELLAAMNDTVKNARARIADLEGEQ